jgi:hypothetical protein
VSPVTAAVATDAWVKSNATNNREGARGLATGYTKPDNRVLCYKKRFDTLTAVTLEFQFSVFKKLQAGILQASSQAFMQPLHHNRLVCLDNVTKFVQHCQSCKLAGKFTRGNAITSSSRQTALEGPDRMLGIIRGPLQSVALGRQLHASWQQLCDPRLSGWLFSAVAAMQHVLDTGTTSNGVPCALQAMLPPPALVADTQHRGMHCTLYGVAGDCCIMRMLHRCYNRTKPARPPWVTQLLPACKQLPARHQRLQETNTASNCSAWNLTGLRPHQLTKPPQRPKQRKHQLIVTVLVTINAANCCSQCNQQQINNATV